MWYFHEKQGKGQQWVSNPNLFTDAPLSDGGASVNGSIITIIKKATCQNPKWDWTWGSAYETSGIT